jgi:hypothetical protein
MPYEPQRVAVVALNYVRPKASVSVSARYQDSVLTQYASSGSSTINYKTIKTFPAEIYLDFAIRAKVSSDAEIYWKATNLLGTSELQFSSIPPTGRVLETGATFWF